MKRIAMGIAAVATLIGTPALAAPPVLSWTGLYIGGNLGGVIGNAPGTSNFVDTADGTTNPQSTPLSQASALGGAQIGYNWQFAPTWVVGIEGDWDWTNSEDSFCRQTDTNSVACSDNEYGFESISSKTDWLATVRGRLGFIIPGGNSLVPGGNTLVYGTGGVAWGQVKTTLTLNCLVDGCGESSKALLASSTLTDTKTGWVAGLGMETMLTPNVSARIEWLHIDLGTITDSLVTFGSSASTQTAVWSRTERFNEIRVGASYLFR